MGYPELLVLGCGTIYWRAWGLSTRRLRRGGISIMAGVSRRQFLLLTLIASVGVLAACQAPATPPAAATAPAAAAKPTTAAAPTTAAGPTTKPAAAAQGTGEWTIAIAEDPDTLDPQKTAAAVTGLVYRYLGDSLVSKDFDGKIAPGLAKGWKVSDDGLTWTFEIKDGVKFHDGTPLDASAIKASFERALSPDTKSPIAGSLLGPVDAIATTGQTLTV